MVVVLEADLTPLWNLILVVLGVLLFIVLGVLALLLYFLPVIVALARQHQQILAIFVLTLLAGWSGWGWVAALVWACMR